METMNPTNTIEKKILKDDSFKEDIKISHTFSSFLANPTGMAGDASRNSRLVVNGYEIILSRLIASKSYNFNPNVYFDRPDNKIYMHIKIPSSSVLNFYYDAVICFDTSRIGNHTSLQNAPIKFYTNSPSFIFTYANSFLKSKLIIDSLIKRLPHEVSEIAHVRNPDSHVGFEKILTLAMLYIQHMGLLNSAVALKFEFKGSKESFFERIESYELKKREYDNKKKLQPNAKTKKTTNIDDTKNIKKRRANSRGLLKYKKRVIKGSKVDMHVNMKVSKQ